MKVRVTALPITGLHVKENLDYRLLNERLNEASPSDIYFDQDIHVDLMFRPMAENGVELKGKVTANYRQPCARCSEEKPRHAELDITLYLKPRLRDDSDLEDDIGIYYFEGDYVDLDPLVHEELIISLHPYWKPEADKSGNCGLCGKSCQMAFCSESGNDKTINNSEAKARKSTHTPLATLGDFFKKN